MWESGNVYRGMYRNDLRHGYGEMFWIDGSVYKGNWVNGEQEGEGSIFLADGRMKQGIFSKNKLTKELQEIKQKPTQLTNKLRLLKIDIGV